MNKKKVGEPSRSGTLSTREGGGSYQHQYLPRFYTTETHKYYLDLTVKGQ